MLRSARAALCLVPALLAITSAARADDAPPLPPATATAPPPGYGQPPPPGYGQPPPPGYGQPPPGYYPPPGYPPPGYYPTAQPPQDTRPLVMDYEEDQPIPPGYHLRTRARRGLIGAGAGVMGGFWLLSVIVGAIGDAAHRAGCSLSLNNCGDGGWAALYVPLVGPFIGIATLNADSSGAALLAADGIAQVGGATMLVLGLTLRQKQLVRDNVALTLSPDVSIMPYFSGKAAGLVGTF